MNVPRSKERRFGRKLVELFDIPLDTVADWPRVVLTANQDAVVQNHRGVIEYDQQVVRINTKMGEMLIAGAGLTLVTALKDEIVVRGKIERIELVDWR
jgi:sporulation protein YqfC